MYNKKRLILAFFIMSLLSACSGLDSSSSHPKKVTGCRDTASVISAEGYEAKGVASIYKSSRQSASCEKVDLDAYTAAHATLPLNTHIKVTNQDNGKSVIIKINDRVTASSAPLLTVTPVVARLLEARGSFPAQIKAITSRRLSTAPSSGGTRLTAKKSVTRSTNNRYYIIVGTYPSQDKAFDRFIRLSSIGLSNTAMETRQIKGRLFHMVRIGPFYDQDKIDKTKDRLRHDGLVKFKVVKN